MSKLIWDKTGERLYETGISNGVIYVRDSKGKYGTGVAWNGLTAVNENPSGAEATALYADNIKYLNLISNEEFGATIEAYTYPDEFKLCNGETELATGFYIGQQKRSTFGMVYKSLIGNDTDGTDYGYKLHFVYGATVAPSQNNHATVNESPEANTFSWELSTTPVEMNGYKPVAHCYVDSTKVDATKLATLEAKIFGDDSTEPSLPLPDEIATILGTT